MLEVQRIRDHKETFIKALKKRGIDATPVINQVLDADDNRRATQSKLDDTLAKANALSKEIGVLFKSGKADQATTLKEKQAL